jgi:hypothetical protein
LWQAPPIYLPKMASNSTLLCIHRDPAQLRLLQEHGYELVTAAEIKHVRPKVPIVMLADHPELPDGALKSSDALVAKSDGPHFLLAAVRFVLNVKPAQSHDGKLRARAPAHRRRPGRSREGADRGQADTPQFATLQLAIDQSEVSFSPRVWRSIRSGSVQF